MMMMMMIVTPMHYVSLINDTQTLAALLTDGPAIKKLSNKKKLTPKKNKKQSTQIDNHPEDGQ